MLGSAPLNRLSDDVLGLIGRGLARFVLESLDQVGRVAARVGLELTEQHLFGFVGRHARDAL